MQTLESYITNLIYTASIKEEGSSENSIYRSRNYSALDEETFDWLNEQIKSSFRWFEKTANGYREIRCQWRLDKNFVITSKHPSFNLNLTFEIFEHQSQPSWLEEAVNELPALFDTRQVI